MELFGTAGIRGSAESVVTPGLALRVGQAVGDEGTEFVVGRDGRETGPALSAAVEAGLASAGAEVRRVGMVPTPVLAYASRGRYGIQITASHNPPTDNGIKVFEDGVEFDREAEQALETTVAEGTTPTDWHAWGKRERTYTLEAYRSDAAAYLRPQRVSGDHPTATPLELPDHDPLEESTIAVDCGNGMGSLATPQVLGRLGADVVTLNGSVDGHFPGRPSKPTPETLTDLMAFVADGDADLGIAHDGDADRVVLVDPDGAVVHEDTVVAIIAEHFVRATDVPDPVVVTTPNASGRIDERVEAAGGRVERVRLGALHEGIHRVTETGGDVVFAAEPWKHIHPGFGHWIDGVVSAGLLSVLVASAGGLDSLRDPVSEKPYRKVSVSCPDAEKKPAMETLESTVPEAYPEATASTEYGVRLDFDDGSWVLVRPSGTEPYIRIYAESEDVDTLVEDVESAVIDAIESV